nr:MAG TPA: hypothetical protein [Caudoviricetes sp.]
MLKFCSTGRFFFQGGGIPLKPTPAYRYTHEVKI